MSQATLGSRIAAGFLLCAGLAACGGGAPPPAPSPSLASSEGRGGAAPVDAARARFNQPLGIARDGAGNLYVADSGNHTIRKISPSGTVTTLAGSPGVSGSCDGTGAAARFSALRGLAVDGAGHVYAVDDGAIRKISPAGMVSTLAGASGVPGDEDGPGPTARFRQPWGIAVDGAGNVYVADTGNALVRKIAPDGMVSTYAGVRGMRGQADGARDTATFLGPAGIAADGKGRLYLTDWYGPPAPNFPEGSTFVRRIDSDGAVSTLAGTMGSDSASPAFMDTFAIAADGDGQVYLAAMRTVRRVGAGGAITPVVGPSALFQVLDGIAVDGGTLYLTDVSNHTVLRVAQDGTVTLIAGKSREPGSADTPGP